MRTRIALAAIIPVALITVSTLAQTAIAPSAHAVSDTSPGTTSPSNSSTRQLLAYRQLNSGGPVLGPSSLLIDLGPTLAHPPAVASALPFTATPVAAVTLPVTPAVTPAPAPVAGPVDTVTPQQRAAWQRVAMCEEGGDWSSNGPRFSGGLGITRSNWIAFGGGAFASEAAMATPDQQIMVAERIQYNPPDQYGCGSW